VAVTSAALLAWSNVVVPLLPAALRIRVAANLGATAVLVLGARRTGLHAPDLGWSRATRGAGVRWGGAALGLATAGYLAALAVPAGRHALARSAPVGTTPAQLAERALVSIPLGTVLCEEVAFRGVLLALAGRRLPVRSAHALTGLVFAAWHVRTARDDVRPGVSLLVTGLGGAALGWLRTRTGSLLAPIGLHFGTNVVGLLAAAAARPRTTPQSRKTWRARSVSASVQPGGGATMAQASSSCAP
jgi:membrane protease YdiL (CAAX protease family)